MTTIDADGRLKFGIFLAPFHPEGQNPTLALERDLSQFALGNVSEADDASEQLAGVGPQRAGAHEQEKVAAIGIRHGGFEAAHLLPAGNGIENA